MSESQSSESLLPTVDPVMQERSDRLQDLVGRQLFKIEVVPLGVMFHFGRKSFSRDDTGVVYWAYGGPK